MSYGVGRRHGSDLAMLWLWRRLVATAPIGPLAEEPPYAMGAALEKAKRHTHTHENNLECSEQLESKRNMFRRFLGGPRKGEVGSTEHEHVVCVQWMLLKCLGSVLSSVLTLATSLLFLAQWIPYSPARSARQTAPFSAAPPTGLSAQSIKCLLNQNPNIFFFPPVFLPFLGPHSWHMEVPRLGV